MQAITLEPINNEVLTILKNMEKLNLVKVIKDENNVVKENSEIVPTFSAIQIDTKGFKFNRDEANER